MREDGDERRKSQKEEKMKKRAKGESLTGGEMRTFKEEKLSHYYLILHFHTECLIY